MELYMLNKYKNVHKRIALYIVKNVKAEKWRKAIIWSG